MKISFAARSETNPLRSNNEDNLYCAGLTLTPDTRDESFVLDGETETPCLVAVFDGMGGMSNGELASLIATQTLSECSADIISPDDDDHTENVAAVQRYVAKANKMLCQTMQEKSSHFGTTLALAVVTKAWIRAYNLGDSRIYVLTEEEFRQISVDHTLAAQKVRLGVITPEQALTDKGRHTLSIHLGVFEDEFSVMAEELAPLPQAEVHRVLLCTDGLTEKVTDAEIEEVLRSEETVGGAASCLMEKALANGGKDNITCIVLEKVTDGEKR